MNPIAPIQHSLLALGAAPILWLMLVLSAASVAIMFERALFFHRTRVDIEELFSALGRCLRSHDIQAAHELLETSCSAEAAVVSVGLAELHRGSNAVREAMAGAALLQRQRLERHLHYLGTLANNAPFIGLFGTVIGIMLAFDQLSLSRAQGSASAAVMASIAEALVTTAIGIGIAVPAVVAFNVFQKRIQVVHDQTAALGHVLLGFLAGERPTDSLLSVATAALARHGQDA